MQAGGRGRHFLIPFLWLVVFEHLECGAAQFLPGRSWAGVEHCVRARVSWMVFALQAAGEDLVEQEELTAGSG